MDLAAADAFGEAAQDAAYQIANATVVKFRCRTILTAFLNSVPSDSLSPEGTAFIVDKAFVVSITFSEA